ncbi:MAG: hypothetical protein U1E27_04310 [Kiritimatiellia bacterium]|nr:hypothetical protein [Kiritimatiellia bacterium]
MKEITLVSPSRDGLLADVSEALGRAGISIEDLEALTVQGWDLVKLVVSDYNRALQALRDAGFPAVTEDAVIIHLKDQPGALAQVTRRLHLHHIRLRSARILHRQDGDALVALSMDQPEEGMRLIQDLLGSQIPSMSRPAD